MAKTAALILAALAGSAAAFTPAKSSKTSVAVNAFAEGMVGGEGPEPMPFTTAKTSKNFDPAGFSEVCFLCAPQSLHPSHPMSTDL